MLGDGLLLASILDFRPRLANRCKVLPVYAILRASILDFRPRFGNQCKLFPVYALFRASILDFRPRLGNRGKVFPVLALFRASILDFRPELGNRCSVIAAAVRNGQPATSVAAKRFSVRFYSSLPQRRTARLLRPSPHRPSASDSILRCGIERMARLRYVVADAGGDRMPRRRHNPK